MLWIIKNKSKPQIEEKDFKKNSLITTNNLNNGR